MTQLILNEDNYTSGVLMDDEVLGGVAETENGTYAAFVVRYATAETVSFQEFPLLQAALQHLAEIKRDWVFRPVGCSGGCGEGSCDEGGCGGHEHGDDEGGCCGGHGHDDDEGGCCGGADHDEDGGGCCGKH